MNYKVIRYVTGWVVFLEGLFLLLPAFVTLIYREHGLLAFLLTSIVCLLLGALMIFRKPKDFTFYAKEAFLIVVLSWIGMSLIGAIPFWVSGTIPSVVDALFETVSGFTTTGASILNDVESLPHGMLFWRSFTHWIGGMGVLVFMLALLPMAGGQTMWLMKAESPGPSVSKLMPNLRKTALFLYGAYSLLTLTQFILLATVGQMPIFDAICSAVGTAGTGGFGVRNTSFAGYTPAAQIITTVFMFLFGVNFTVYFLLWKRRFKAAFGIEELRWYVLIYLGGVIAILLNLLFTTGQFFENIRDVFFQAASMMTTTGFSTVDFDKWPQFSRTVMVVLMFVGACAGSTGGGIKVSRFILWIKSTGIELIRMVHPRSVRVLKMDGKAIDRDTQGGLNVYLICYIGIYVLSLLLISFDGFDLTTNFTSVVATLNNIGPGLNMVGPAGNFAHFSVLSKIVLIFDMLAGRLEIFPILLVFFPSTWKK